MKSVFLGGTCNESTWRETLIDNLKIDYYNPVVEDWTPDCMVEERKQREKCDYCLYVISPEMTGVYSIAEVIDDSNKRPKRTIFYVVHTCDTAVFSDGQIKSLYQVGEMIKRNGGKWFQDWYELVDYLNGVKK